jgi:hypothetical protein
MRRLAIALLAGLVLAPPAAADSVSEILSPIAANARFPAPTRADVRIERRRDAAKADGAAVLLGRGRTLYVETRDGTRALVRPSKIVVRHDARVVRAAPGTRLGATDVLLEDLIPVTRWLFKVPQVSDQGPTGTVLTGAPAFPSPRALIVLTIDPDTHALTRAKYYEKSVTDLAAFRRDEAFTSVDGHARPTRITVERARDGTSTRLELSWRPAPETPRETFAPRGLRAASSIVW